MSTTRTVDDLQILLAQHDIEIKDANAFTAQYADKPETTHAICNLIEAFYHNPELANQLGVGNTIQDFLGYIPDVILGIEEEQKKHPENKHALTGEDLVINAIENITTLFDPTKLASFAKKDDSPQHKGEQMIAPLTRALNQVQEEALPGPTARQRNSKICRIVTGFIGCGLILGGIACLAITISSIPLLGPVGLAMALYCSAALIGQGVSALGMALDNSPALPYNDNARRKNRDVELGELSVFRREQTQQSKDTDSRNIRITPGPKG